MKPYYHILLLEDDKLHKELIFRAFEDLSEFHLSWVGNLAQARTFLTDTIPDLIISDSYLADGTGIELSAELNSLCPFILMTSFGNEEPAVNLMKAGVSDYLVKSPDVLLALPDRIRRVLREWDNVTAFDKSIPQSLDNKVKMEAYLRTAISSGEFCLYYQPQVGVDSNRIYGFEALLRWNSPKFGLVSPLQFIKLAEETGLIVPIGDWVLRRACAFAAVISQKHPDIQVWVNISNIQLLQTDFVDRVKAIIETAGLPPHILGIEITESVLMESFEGSASKLMELRNYGLGIALDDFGTGYSSLNYLKKLPINLVKIDKSFIDDISGPNIDEKEITSLIVQLAHKIGLKVVGEGVETEAQMAFLKEYQCNFIQGYLISKPIPEERVEEFLGQF